MAASTRTLLDGAVSLSRRLVDGAIEMEQHPALRHRPALRDRLADSAADFLALVYGADANAHYSDYRSRVEALNEFHASRDALSRLRHVLSVVHSEGNIDTTELVKQANELMPLLIAVALALRDRDC
ncbi:MAG: hypothetical protein KC482_14505 [Dehalococcoidia bacterium]|nr:hypothetical protein [Dehalococcoidia bacterium]MCA9825330.1 hypothetical protein [Dehalococcoidia bacterium]MCA9843714.1 hypothetical protein [Dehalococcoidia bacterium]MCA9854775.1 hypothetical protein [Dehalococcoidia bacterium]